MYVNMCVYTHIQIYLNTYLQIYLYTYIHIYKCMYIYIYIYLFIYVCVCVYIYKYMYISIYLYMRMSLYVYMYVCIYRCTFVPHKREHVAGDNGIRYSVCVYVCVFDVLVCMFPCIIYGWVDVLLHMHIQCIYIHTYTFVPCKREHVVGANGIRCRVCNFVCMMNWYVCMYVSYMDGWKHGCICIFSVYIYISVHFCLASESK